MDRWSEEDKQRRQDKWEKNGWVNEWRVSVGAMVTDDGRVKEKIDNGWLVGGWDDDDVNSTMLTSQPASATSSSTNYLCLLLTLLTTTTTTIITIIVT